MSIAENLAQIQMQIAKACERANRPENEVKLMAVSKTHPAEALAEAQRAGLRLFGENRVQEFQQKILQLDQLHLNLAPSPSPGAQVEYHLIGPLQSNKAAKAASLFHSIDTVDSLRLAQRLNEAAMALDKTLPMLIEIKLSPEPSKHGAAPASLQLAELLEALPNLTHLRPRGLMTIPPFSDDPEQARPYFRQLRTLRDQLATQHPHLNFAELSMGMSHDFHIAIEEGSTCSRIGAALFGKRAYPQ